MLRLVVVRGSPRRSGNSDYLMGLFLGELRGLGPGGLEVREFRPDGMRIRPCQACGGCDLTGECIIRDDMDQIYEAVRWAEGIAVSSPVFFASMPAQAKAMVDRFQCAWVAKYRLGVPWVDASAGRRLALLTVGAMTISRFHEQIKDVVRAWAAVVNFRMRGEAAFLGVDEAGAIRTLAGVEGKVLATARDFLECR